MPITIIEINGKTFFVLPKIRLEMVKLSDYKPSKPKVIANFHNLVVGIC